MVSRSLKSQPSRLPRTSFAIDHMIYVLNPLLLFSCCQLLKIRYSCFEERLIQIARDIPV